MNYPKTIDGMRYEVIAPDPFYRGKVQANLQALKKKQIARLSQGPHLAEPIIAEAMRTLYKGWHMLLRVVFWSLTWVDGKFREFADV